MAAVTIATNAALGPNVATLNAANQRVHEIGGNLYAVVIDKADGDPQVYKSTDQGATWTNMNAAGAPNGDNANAFRYILDVAKLGTNLYILYRTGAGNLTVSPFSTTTDTWGVSLGTATSASFGDATCKIAVRSDGDVIVGYRSSVSQADIQYARYEGGSWTASDVMVLDDTSGTASNLLDIVMDSTDIAYFVYSVASLSDLYYRSLDGSNTFGTATALDTSISQTADRTTTAMYVPYDVGGTDTITVAFCNSTDDIDANVITLESASASGNVAAQESDIHTGTDLGENIIATFAYGGTRYIFWTDLDDDDILYISNSGSGWGTAGSNQTVWKSLTGPTALGYVGPLLGGVGATWDENGTVSFEWFIPPPATATLTADTLAISGKSLTATAGISESATMTASALTVSGKTVTATAEISASATMTADTLTVSGKTVTGTAAISAAATMTRDTLAISGKTVTASAGASATLTADTLVVSGKAVTGLVPVHASATLTRDTLTVVGGSVVTPDPPGAYLLRRGKWTQRLVLIAGIPTDCTDASTAHSVNGNGIGQATLTLEAPYPAHVAEGATLEIQAGYRDQMMTVFGGTIPKLTPVHGTRGRWTTVTGRGHLDRMTDEHPEEITFTGPIAMKEAMRSLMELRQMPYYLIDDITWPDGETVILASNSKANEGKITIPVTIGLRQWMQAALAFVGYRLFDQPNTLVRIKRISGEPVGDSVINVAEGVLGLSFSRTIDLDPMITYNIVRGVRFTDEAGIQRTIRSIPAAVDLDPRLQPLGYRKGEINNDLIDTQANADYARNVLEIDRAAPAEPHEWQTELAPHVQTGDVATVTSETVGAEGLLWVTDVVHNLSSGSLKTTTFDGSRGNGEALPAGSDCVTTTILPGSVHLGDEVLSWYRTPVPASATQVVIPFIPVADYTSIYALIDAHGTNSYMLGGKNADSTVSRFEIWQGGEKKSEGNLKVLGEDYSKRLPYGPSDTYWSKDIAIPMTGSLDGGVVAELRIISGRDTRASAGPMDDFEVKNVRLVQCGVGVPIFVGSI